MERVRVIIGLGNPGEEYRKTRHNVGFLALDQIATANGTPWVWERRFQADTSLVDFGQQPVLLVKPRTFVNRSGETASLLARYYRYPAERFCAVYDDITLDPGRIKLSASGSAGGHNGVSDLMNRLGSGFYRMRIGIGAKRHPQMDLKDWVLGKISNVEEEKLEDAYTQAHLGLELLVAQGIERAMNKINTKSKAS
ncbi:MAG: aminoacyl-tRNA hydrolase [Puniceicoccales bacterium]